MVNQSLARYLAAHWAEGNALVDLLDQLERTHPGSPIAGLAAGLRDDVRTDLATLEQVQSRLGLDLSGADLPLGTSWLAPHFARLREGLDATPAEPFPRLEVFEALSLSIEGKRLLWRSLRAAVGDQPAITDIDFAALERRAVDQRGGVEAFRLGSAQGAFRTS